jgi:hypothetical protein
MLKQSKFTSSFLNLYSQLTFEYEKVPAEVKWVLKRKNNFQSIFSNFSKTKAFQFKPSIQGYTTIPALIKYPKKIGIRASQKLPREEKFSVLFEHTHVCVCVWLCLCGCVFECLHMRVG